MFQNYLKISLRNFLKNFAYVSINVLGLGLAVACCLTAYLINEKDFAFDQSQPNTEQIYRVNSFRVLEGRNQQWGISPLPVGPALARELPEVESSTRYMGARGQVQYEDKFFSEFIHSADTNFFSFFTFNLLKGAAKDFHSPTSIFISTTLAKKYFGDEDPMGKQLSVKYADTLQAEYQVAGVFEKIPTNSSIVFDAIVNIESQLKSRAQDPQSWVTPLTTNFVKLSSQANTSPISEQLATYVPIQNEARENWKVNKFYLEPFKDMKKNSEDTYGTYTSEGLPAAMLVGTAVIGLLVILLACFNFANISIAISSKRMKEIGVRKTLGGLKQHLILQFLFENLILSALGLALGLAIGEFMVPAYNLLWPIELETHYLDSPITLLFLFGLLFGVTLISGLYPAYYISKFEPTAILKGVSKIAGTNGFTRVMLTLQFAISIIALVASVIFAQNATYQNEVNLGFDRENVIMVPLAEANDFEPLKNELRKDPRVQEVAGSANHIGWSSGLSTLYRADKQYEVRTFSLGENYINTLGLELVAGRDFREDSDADQERSVIVNEALVKSLDLENPVGERVKISSSYFIIVGVVKDFMPYGLYVPIQPSILVKGGPENYNYLTIRTAPKDQAEVLAMAKTTWSSLVPNKPFEGVVQEESMEDSKRTNNNIRGIFFFVSLLVLFMSASGLFAMVSLNILKRKREIGIRKILGASIGHIATLLNREFVIVMLISGVIGAPVGYYLAEMLLDDIYAYYLDLDLSSVAIAMTAIFVTAFGTVGYKVYQAATRNPTESLRVE